MSTPYLLIPDLLINQLAILKLLFCNYSETSVWT